MTFKHLRKLIEYMETLPASANKNFGMRYWFEHKGKKHQHGLLEGDVLGKDQLQHCGTRACAAGWASTMPYFRKRGLKMVWKDGDADLVCENAMYQDEDFFVQLGEVFELHHERISILFGPENIDETPKQWAKRARHCISVWKGEEA